MQAGPSDENGNGINDDVEDMDGDGEIDADVATGSTATVTALPNTGAGNTQSTDEYLLLITLAAGAAIATAGVTALRKHSA